jgi:hypothetical protein
MALNNIENQIKEKLNAREIQPSAPAWDRLDAMLSVAETKQPRRNFTWLYVAASLLLFFGLGFFLLNTNETVMIENTIPVVTNETTIEKVEENIEVTEENQLPKEKVFKTFEEKKIVENKGKKNENQPTLAVNNRVRKKEDKVVLPTSNFQLPASSTHYPSPNNYKYVSPEELLAQIEQPSKSDSSKIKVNASTKIKVDANELLTKVEQEVHQKHKESTIDKLRRNFNEVKSAVANRNYE